MNIWAALTLVAAESAAAGGRFKVEPISVQGDVIAVVAADLDGDGRKDLLAAYTTGVPPYQKRFVAVFWNRLGVFAPRPDLTLPFNDDEVCAFDVGVIGDGPAEELLLVTPRAVLAQSFRGRVAEKPRKLLEQQTLFHQPIPGELPRIRLVQNLFRGRELLVPSLGALSIWRRGGQGYEKAAEIEIDMDVSSGPRRRRAPESGTAMPAFEVSYAFPTLSIADFDGDGVKDLFASQEDRVAVYRQTGPLTFNRQPDFTRDFAIRTPDDHRERSSNAVTLVSDIDGDGIADLVLRKQVFQGVTSATSVSYVFWGKKGGGYAQEAAQQIKSEGIGLLQIQLVDLTGDGHPDLIVPSTTFGVFAIVRMLTAKTAKVNFQVFPFDPRRRRFAADPMAERELKFHLALGGDSDMQAVYFGADLTGDGKPDLVFGTSEEELSIFGYDPKTLFAEEPAEVVEVRAAGSIEAVDLDRKGRSDLLLYYPQTRGHRGEIVVLVNVGPW